MSVQSRGEWYTFGRIFRFWVWVLDGSKVSCTELLWAIGQDNVWYWKKIIIGHFDAIGFFLDIVHTAPMSSWVVQIGTMGISTKEMQIVIKQII